MERITVESRNIASIGYNPSSDSLECEFKSGGVYWYHDVPQEVYDALMAAESKGKYFGQHIKGKYQCVKISGGEKES